MRLKSPQDPSRMFVRIRYDTIVEFNVDFANSTGFLGSFSFSCLLMLDLDNFRFIQVDFVAEGGF